MSAGATFERVWQPKPGAKRTLLMLHGTGGDEHDLLPLAKMLDPDANVLSPRGKVLENGAPRFFRRHGMGQLDLEDLAARTQELADWIRDESERSGFAIETVCTVGFSNGANIAAALLFERPEVISSAVLVRAMLPYRPPSPPRAKGRRVLILAGTHDPYSRQPVTEELEAILRGGGAEVTTHFARAGHELTAEDVRVAKGWLAPPVA